MVLMKRWLATKHMLSCLVYLGVLGDLAASKVGLWCLTFLSNDVDWSPLIELKEGVALSVERSSVLTIDWERE